MKGGAPGVETPAHKDGAQERRTRTAHKDGRRNPALTRRAQELGGGSSPRGGREGARWRGGGYGLVIWWAVVCKGTAFLQKKHCWEQKNMR